ncbi:MAG: PTS glucitol/sorbitol transporter subunit IIA [Anaerolineales bacterium]|nr:PTS glucitol/sorbitol transporter subunit IIA [Anaerolineales bacterium]MCB9431970.1 PTS glucitol/sorbitol transporter subunit IIA [Ardenticatenaceae bacterium]
MVKYEATVTAIGPLVSDFLDYNIIVLFGQNAPEELAEFAILHDGQTLQALVQPGDEVWFDATSFRVLAVGEVANANLANLGHLVVKVNGETEVEMPGDVCVELKALPAIEVGTKVRVEGE